jgi:sulfite reductase (NADPH) flavoprotein alpha-component
LEYAVLGFGSRNYPEFCKFAQDINQQFLSLGNLVCNTPIHLVNQQSLEDFNQWKEQWMKNNGLEEFERTEIEDMKYVAFEVSDLTQANEHPRETFMLSLFKPKKINLFNLEIYWLFVLQLMKKSECIH